ncbi:SsrA-binding protein SmpB [Salinivirga cyanobacteriivorans]|uniref:SsrA-binding protein n=1 Tax=Salinivirga cyanobacteriivorans TaxID=1307839 RepID=A0A0S2I461_9BACT|nr:SsrA-binding protein SmpB [Salinivirga cyanobacteriivorans]ALO16957.1 SsrA-binding protein [Salinivirga cyanobacteriivorans]
MNINIKNKKASFEYEFIETFVAGIQLTGTEIKSIRQGKASIAEAYCYFDRGELWVKSMHIAEYSFGNRFNHEMKRERKLLLNKKELRKLQRKIKEKGLTIIPTRLFVNDRGWAKMKIALAKGKKVYDKRQSIKEKDMKRDMDRIRKF